MGIPSNPIKGTGFRGKSLYKMSHLAKSYIKFLQQARNPAFISNRSMSAGHNPDGWKMWKKIFFFVLAQSLFLETSTLLCLLMHLRQNLLLLCLMIIFASELRNFLGVTAITP